MATLEVVSVPLGGGGLQLLARKQVVLPVVPGTSGGSMSVDGFLTELQGLVHTARKGNPELEGYHLHDVSLRMDAGELQAIMEFRK